MPRSSQRSASFGKQSIRDWTLYVIRTTDDCYYIGITAYKDFMHRISQHGGRAGAKWLRNKQVQEVVEVQHLGRLSSKQAQNIENNVTLEYRKRFGSRNVRGGYDAYTKHSLVPTYTPGSLASIIFVVACLALALVLLVFISRR